MTADKPITPETMRLSGFIKHYRKEIKNARARMSRNPIDTAVYGWAERDLKFYKGELAMALTRCAAAIRGSECGEEEQKASLGFGAGAFPGKVRGG